MAFRFEVNALDHRVTGFIEIYMAQLKFRPAVSRAAFLSRHGPISICRVGAECSTIVFESPRARRRPPAPPRILVNGQRFVYALSVRMA
ncbi:hypothetical protein EVAR_15867_1 [Eumeta japonica]|uniref:Uncharacterized protein n=1 Tax=Eumeta variegata TaxID=151549 RepID=A0A4C1UDY3_EUMVA|nr:hypothetical protein EVAR_15867_1 [Eumeta japonica]